MAIVAAVVVIIKQEVLIGGTDLGNDKRRCRNHSYTQESNSCL